VVEVDDVPELELVPELKAAGVGVVGAAFATPTPPATTARRAARR